MKRMQLQVSEYIEWIVKKYHEISKEFEAREAYKIIEVKSTLELRIHIVGTGKEFTCSPRDIVASDHFLDGFSKKDIRAITYLACAEDRKPTVRILEQRFSEKLKKFIFRINHNDQIIEKSSAEISADPALLSKLNPKDAHCIGYIFGSESVLQEVEEKRKLKG
jgi:hypothetical protein